MAATGTAADTDTTSANCVCRSTRVTRRCTWTATSRDTSTTSTASSSR
jgi:hypothetical protein